MVVLTAFLNGYAASVYGAYANANRQAAVQATTDAVNRASRSNTAPDWQRAKGKFDAELFLNQLATNRCLLGGHWRFLHDAAVA